MYIIHTKNPDSWVTSKEIKQILILLDLSRSTFERNMRLGVWDTEKFTIRKVGMLQNRYKNSGNRGI
jgi:hypothetical protein